MSAWIETTAGSLVKVKASSMIISVRQAKGSTDWEVTVNGGPGPALFAAGLNDEATAQRIRNAVAIKLDRSGSAKGSLCISFIPGDRPAVLSAPLAD